MKRIKWLLLIFASIVLSANAEMIVFTNINQIIPDNTASGVQDTQEISGLEPFIMSVSVYFSLSAPGGDFAYNGDYYVSLQHDTGFSILLNRTGRTSLNSLGYGDNGFDILFAPGGDDIHSYQSFTYSLDAEDRLTGTWDADGRNVDPDFVLDTDARTAQLDSFYGLNPNGNWTLFVADMAQNGIAQVDEWGLDIAAVPEPATAPVLFIGYFLAWSFYRVKRYVTT